MADKPRRPKQAAEGLEQPDNLGAGGGAGGQEYESPGDLGAAGGAAGQYEVWDPKDPAKSAKSFGLQIEVQAADPTVTLRPSDDFYQGQADGLGLGEEFHHNRIQLVAAQVSGPTPAPGMAGRWTGERVAQTFMELVAEGSVDPLPPNMSITTSPGCEEFLSAIAARAVGFWFG